MATISGSVGQNGTNDNRDVRAVQRLLNRHSLPPLRALTVDGAAGAHTIDAIRHFQSVAVKMRSPDGRVDPGGKTLRRLQGGPESSESRAASGVDAPPAAGTGKLSGARWWRANQQRYPNSRRLEDLAGTFRDNVSAFVREIRAGGGEVAVSSTLRNPIRAHLMHYSWKVANGDVAPEKVPGIAGLNIEWDHRELSASRKGAREMKDLFNMAHLASLNSNHIRGNAIDMTITWNGRLSLHIPGRAGRVDIRSGPRDGSRNRELHRLGREFGVRKLLNDPPHWSANGR